MMTKERIAQLGRIANNLSARSYLMECLEEIKVLQAELLIVETTAEQFQKLCFKLRDRDTWRDPIKDPPAKNNLGMVDVLTEEPAWRVRTYPVCYVSWREQNKVPKRRFTPSTRKQ